MTISTKTTRPAISLPEVGRRLAVICDGSAVSIIGSEGAVRIRFEADGHSARLVSNGVGGDVVVAEGTTGDMIDLFADLRAQAVPRRPKPLLRAVGMGTAALAIIAFAGLVSINLRQSVPAFDPATLARAMEAAGVKPNAAGTIEALKAGEQTKLSVPSQQADARSVPFPSEMPSLDQPVQAVPTAKEPPASTKAPAVAKLPTPPTAAVPTPANDTAKGSVLPPVAAPPAAPPAAAAPAPEAVPAKPGQEVEKQDAGKKDAASAKAEEPKDDQVSIAQAIARMNPIEAAKAVQGFEAIKKSLADTGEIPPEVWRELPHEIAAVLKRSGVPLTASERREAGRKVASVVRLHEKAIDHYRGKDGISSIPDSNSWVLTDNNVLLPLPGGGDIRTADTMKEFGLQP